MSRDMLTVGSTMRIPLLYRGEYSQWVERFMNYLEEQTDGEAMINSIKNGDQPLPRVTQVSIAGTSSTYQPPLKDKSMCNKIAKDLCNALARHMLGSEYGEQDREAAVLYEYETFKATEGELLLGTYIRYIQVINDLKKCGYSKYKCELIFKFLNNLQPEWKQYATTMRQNKNLMDINIDALYNILNKRKEKVVVSSDSKESDADDFSELKKITALLAKAFNRRKFYFKPTNNNLRTSSTSQSTNKKQEFVKFNDKKVENKDDEKKQDMSKVKCYNCKKEGHFAKDFKKVKVKDYEYYKTKMLLAKKYKDEQVLFARGQAWMESSSDSDQEINANMVFMAQIQKVLSDSKTSSSSTNDKISEVSYYLSESESKSEYETSDYYDNTTTYGLFVNDNDDQEIFHDCENFPENLIESQINHNKSAVNHNDSEGVDKLIRKLTKRLLNLDTFSSVRRHKHSDVIWKKKRSSNTSNVDLSSVSHLKLNKDVKRYSRKDMLSCNNSYLGETSSAYVCNHAINVSCNYRLCNLFDENNLFIFNDESVRISPVSKMPFKKKPRDSMNVCSKSNLNKSLPRTVHRWLPKMQPLAEPVAKWIPKIVQICLWIIDSECLKHITGNRALLTNFVKKFLGTVRFGLPKMKFEKDHLCSTCEQGKIHQKHHKSKTAFASIKPLYLLHMDLCGLMHGESINEERYVLVVVDDYSRTPQQNGIVERRNQTLVEAARTMLTFANLPLFLWAKSIAIACFTQNRESSSSSLNDDVQQSLEEVILLQTNTQSISNNIIPNVDEVSTSYNVFNERLEDAYFDSSTSFHDPSNVHTFYYPYPHEKKWTKDHPLHKTIGDRKSSVRTRGQLANSCLFSWLLSFIEPAKNKKDQSSFVNQNKAMLVAVGYSQQEGITYDKMFALVARIEAIRLFLAYAAHKCWVIIYINPLNLSTISFGVDAAMELKEKH
uniref:CCHC-type domain-containing protein n=1 Tax=Tanacetum cinerariifolium TaxID=118510 RepID=A0A6L2N9B4_TANCI|nr:hypothetical protein [Tanacetum cinerariifolium]